MKKMKIIQIQAQEKGVWCLGNDGNLYWYDLLEKKYWKHNGLENENIKPLGTR